MRAYLDLSLRLAFRTRESTGLLLYNAGRRSDFLALELADGHLHLVAGIGGRIVELKDNYPEGVNDNQWHVLVVARTGKDGQCALTTFKCPPFHPDPSILSLFSRHHILIATQPISQISYSSFLYSFWLARMCWPLLCLCRPFVFFEMSGFELRELP